MERVSYYYDPKCSSSVLITKSFRGEIRLLIQKMVCNLEKTTKNILTRDGIAKSLSRSLDGDFYMALLLSGIFVVICVPAIILFVWLFFCA